MIRYVLLWPIDTFMTIFSLIVSPILPLFAREDIPGGNLPHWLNWFETPDNPLDGDQGHKDRHVNSSKYWQRTCWLARNRCYNFTINVIGFELLPGHLIIEEGDKLTGNRPIHPGIMKRKVVGTDIFQYYQVHQWGFNKNKCMRINTGWKLWNRRTPGKSLKCQYVFSFNPWMDADK